MTRPRSQRHLLVQGGTVVTQDGNRSILTADVLITDGIISAVAHGISPPSPTRLLDARGMVVIPGLIQLGASLEGESALVPGMTYLIWGVTSIAGYERAIGTDTLQQDLDDSGIRTVRDRKITDGTDAFPRDRVDASAWFDGVTRGNARLLGLEAELGSLAPGKAGDLVVLDMQDFRAMSHPGAQWLERVLWNLKCGLIRWVVVDGEIVFRQTSQCPTPKDPLSSPTFARG